MQMETMKNEKIRIKNWEFCAVLFLSLRANARERGNLRRNCDAESFNQIATASAMPRNDGEGAEPDGDVIRI